MGVPYMIGIAGHSGAGKSTLARGLAVRLVGTTNAVLSLDAYHHPRQPARRSGELLGFDEPGALDLDLLSEHLLELSRGVPVDRPSYDFHTHTRRPATVRVEPGPALIVEGRLALFREDVRSHFSTALFVTADADTCLARRVVRDMRERGRSESSVRQQWQQTVQPMFARYVAPTARYADLMVDGLQPVDAMVDAALRHLVPVLR